MVEDGIAFTLPAAIGQGRDERAQRRCAGPGQSKKADGCRLLQQLKQIGTSIAVDDFGTGYSSLAYLKRFPIDVLKIDHSFVRDLGEDADDAAICASILALARALRMEVIAEGVESPVQLDFLTDHGCRYVQGYLFAKPMDAGAATAFLERQAAREQPVAVPV